MRRLVFIAVLLSQPLSAIGAAWQADAGHIDPAAASHCEGASHSAAAADSGQSGQQHDGAAQQADAAHADCGSTCNHCASCAAMTVLEDAAVHVLPSLQPQPMSDSRVPVGMQELLYRPPIIA